MAPSVPGRGMKNSSELDHTIMMDVVRGIMNKMSFTQMAMIHIMNVQFSSLRAQQRQREQ